MKLLLLSGNSLRNKDWIYVVEKVLAPLFTDTLVHEYAHWKNGQPMINFEFELETLNKELEDFGEYCIFAKSVGTVLSLMGMNAGILNPEKCLFTGLPLNLIKNENIPVKGWFEVNQLPIILVQNTADPLGGYNEVKTYLESAANNLLMVELPGESHDYEDFDKIKALTSKLLTTV